MAINRKVQFFSFDVITEENGNRRRNEGVENIFTDIKNAQVDACKMGNGEDHYNIIDVLTVGSNGINGIMTKVRRSWMAKVIRENEKSPRRQLQLNSGEFIGELTYFQIFDFGADISGQKRYVLATLRDSYGPWYGSLEKFLLGLSVLNARNIKEVNIKPLIKEDIVGQLSGRRKPYSLNINIRVLEPISKELRKLDESIFAAGRALQSLGGKNLSIKIQIAANKSLRSKGVKPLEISIGRIKTFFNALTSNGKMDLIDKFDIKLRDEITEKITSVDLLEDYVMFKVEFRNDGEILDSDLVHRKIQDSYRDKRDEISTYFR
ncbi:MAG: hypothetical protein QXL94_04560 [Candidatus Parvarchaeum sp.]